MEGKLMLKEKFNFETEVKKKYPNREVLKSSLKDIYNLKNGKGHSTEQTKKKGVYALFYNEELKKIGKATDKNGIFHRMSQYYRGDTNGGLKEIDEGNRDEIKVLYFNLPSEEECWVEERRFQVLAYDCGEKMPWENKSRN